MKQLSIFFCCALLFLTAVFLLNTPTAQAATFNVTSTADALDSNPGDGVCQTGSGDCTLRAAIQEANETAAADVINLPAGTFMLSLVSDFEENSNLEGDLDIFQDLTISGSGQGVTILDGGMIDRIFHVRGDNTNFTLTDLTLQNGVADNRVVGAVWGGTLINDGSTVTIRAVTAKNSIASRGGAFANVGSMTIENSLLDNNEADDFGGGIYSHEGSLSLVEVTVQNNETAVNDGGGIRALNTEVSIEDSLISNNDSGARGGGFSAQARGSSSVTVSIDNSTFRGNTATESGGAIFNWRPLTLTNSVVENNEATEGGGIYSDESLTVEDSTIQNNVTSGSGGGVYIRRGVPMLDNVQIAGNEAGGSGGGILFEQPIVLSNSAVVSNTAVLDGGGLYGDTTGTLTNVTIAHNSTDGSGGGIFLQGGRDEITLVLSYTSVGFNSGSPAGGIHASDNLEAANIQLSATALGSNSNQQCVGNIVSPTDSVASDGSCQLSGATNQPNSDPRFAPAADNGGDTFTMALLPLSAAVEAAAPATCPATDQRGTNRPINVGGGASRCDAGAFEYAGPTNFVGVRTELPAFEGDRNRQAIFTIFVWFPQSNSLSVDYATVNDSATAGSDFVGRNGTVNFAAGETEKTVAVTILGDYVIEGSEQFSVQLSNGQNTTIAVPSATLILIEDDHKAWFPYLSSE